MLSENSEHQRKPLSTCGWSKHSINYNEPIVQSNKWASHAHKTVLCRVDRKRMFLCDGFCLRVTYMKLQMFNEFDHFPQECLYQRQHAHHNSTFCSDYLIKTCRSCIILDCSKLTMKTIRRYLFYEQLNSVLHKFNSQNRPCIQHALIVFS